jgi:RNA polymerase sigma-70 factor (ECF subfamily)
VESEPKQPERNATAVCVDPTTIGFPRARPAPAGAAMKERFARIVRVFGPAISRTARSYAKTLAERQDLEQDIALAIWRALPSFRGDCSERAFVLRIAHNQSLSFITRRRSGLGTTPLEHDARDPSPDPEVLVGLSERMRAVFRAIHALPFGQRQVLVLTLEGLAHEEIGDVLGISVNNVAVRVNRARAELKKTLGDER